MLYHYTDFIAFDGIIRDAELRLNNILNMNDTAEMRLFMNGLCDAISNTLIRNGYDSLAPVIRNFFDGELAEEFHYSAYAACFSRYRDDAAQWERYGHLGQGVCIAFHENLLEKLIGDNISLKEVYYQEKMDNHPLVQHFYLNIMEHKDNADFLESMKGIMKDAWLQSAAFKHPSFESEREFRLVVSPFVSARFPIAPRYHVSEARIKKYYPLDLALMCSQNHVNFEDLVAEIIIGPTSSQSPPILQDYLADNHLSSLADKISVSACPLRKATL